MVSPPTGKSKTDCLVTDQKDKSMTLNNEQKKACRQGSNTIRNIFRRKWHWQKLNRMLKKNKNKRSGTQISPVPWKETWSSPITGSYPWVPRRASQWADLGMAGLPQVAQGFPNARSCKAKSAHNKAMVCFANPLYSKKMMLESK